MKVLRWLLGRDAREAAELEARAELDGADALLAEAHAAERRLDRRLELLEARAHIKLRRRSP